MNVNRWEKFLLGIQKVYEEDNHTCDGYNIESASNKKFKLLTDYLVPTCKLCPIRNFVYIHVYIYTYKLDTSSADEKQTRNKQKRDVFCLFFVYFSFVFHLHY